MLYLEIINTFVKKIIYASYGNLSKELKNGIKISWVIYQNIIFIVLIYNLKNRLAY